MNVNRCYEYINRCREYIIRDLTYSDNFSIQFYKSIRQNLNTNYIFTTPINIFMTPVDIQDIY